MNPRGGAPVTTGRLLDGAKRSGQRGGMALQRLPFADQRHHLPAGHEVCLLHAPPGPPITRMLDLQKHLRARIAAQDPQVSTAIVECPTCGGSGQGQRSRAFISPACPRCGGDQGWAGSGTASELLAGLATAQFVSPI